MIHTHYDNLRITRNATPGLIKAAYRALSQEFHPDRNPDRDTTRIMQIINDAYLVLSDPVTRKQYDAKIDAEEAAAAGRGERSDSPKPRAQQTEADQARRTEEAARAERVADAAERKRRAEKAERRRLASESAEYKRRAEAAAEQARREIARSRRWWHSLLIVLIVGVALLGAFLAFTRRLLS